jgi:hypothetical protein
MNVQAEIVGPAADEVAELHQDGIEWSLQTPK